MAKYSIFYLCKINYYRKDKTIISIKLQLAYFFLILHVRPGTEVIVIS